MAARDTEAAVRVGGELDNTQSVHLQSPLPPHTSGDGGIVGIPIYKVKKNTLPCTYLSFLAMPDARDTLWMIWIFSVVRSFGSDQLWNWIGHQRFFVKFLAPKVFIMSTLLGITAE